jgi:hypothetical protein
MDVTLAGYRGMDAAQSDQTIRRLAATCRRYRMPLTLLFHNDTFDPVTWADWRSMYQRLLPDIAR